MPNYHGVSGNVFPRIVEGVEDQHLRLRVIIRSNYHWHLLNLRLAERSHRESKNRTQHQKIFHLFSNLQTPSITRKNSAAGQGILRFHSARASSNCITSSRRGWSKLFEHLTFAAWPEPRQILVRHSPPPLTQAPARLPLLPPPPLHL